VILTIYYEISLIIGLFQISFLRGWIMALRPTKTDQEGLAVERKRGTARSRKFVLKGNGKSLSPKRYEKMVRKDKAEKP
jgi:hypothetical protein